MNLAEYQKLAKRTLGDACLTNLRMGVIGETGEIVDYIKKVEFHGHELKREKLIEELGDLMWYVASVGTLNNFSMELAEPPFDGVALYAQERNLSCLAMNLFGDVSDFLHELRDPLIAPYTYVRVVHKIVLLAGYVDATLSDVMEHNIEKLKKRYPNGFEPKRSINRG